jgi:hypothetical protein
VRRIGLIVPHNPWNRPPPVGVHARMNRTVPGLLVVLLVLSACAASGGSPGSSAGTSGDPSPPASAQPSDSGGGGGDDVGHPTGADEPILVVSNEGGFMMIDMMAVQMPSFVLLGDGRVIVQGTQTLEFPGPALPALQERTLTEEGIQLVLAEFEDSGLFTGAEIELLGMQNMVADASTTVFTLNAGDLQSRVAVYGLGTWSEDMGMDPPPGVDQAELDAHELLNSLNNSLLALDMAVPADAWESEGWQPYEPDAFLLYVRDVTGEPIEGGPEQVREWPTDDDPATFGEVSENFGNGTRCGVADGELGEAWFTELSQSNQMTTWTTDGEDRWSVRARPLLPHEERVCPELFGAA